jgi:hypothetical protein
MRGLSRIVEEGGRHLGRQITASRRIFCFPAYRVIAIGPRKDAGTRSQLISHCDHRHKGTCPVPLTRAIVRDEPDRRGHTPYVRLTGELPDAYTIR